MTDTFANRRRLTAAQTGFGVFALAIHLGLLLIPLTSTEIRTTQNPPALPVITIDLFSRLSEEPEAKPEPLPIDPDTPVDVAQANESETTPNVVTNTTADEMSDPASTPVTHAYLLDQAADLKLPPAKPDTVIRRAIPALPDNLSKPVLAYIPTVFSEAYLPVTTEILDQWQEPGGVVHAVIRTPGGKTLCGRREPWNPINPLVEPVTMWHACGGGGKRKNR